jgi:hypothetical protein
MSAAFDAGRISPSFAQSTAEFTLSDSDDDGAADDLRFREAELAGEGEAYELKERGRDIPHSGDEDEDDGSEDEESWVDVGDAPGSRRRRRVSASTVASFQLYTPDEESAVVRKFDRKLVLFVALLFMLSFLDRSSTFSPMDSITSPIILIIIPTCLDRKIG